MNTLTGEGLAEALQGASVVVDVSNSPSFEDDGRHGASSPHPRATFSSTRQQPV